MKLFKLRADLKQQFNQHNIDEVDVDIILSMVFKVPRTELILLDEVDNKSLKRIKKIVKARLKHKPIDKITKTAYFYKDKFYVNQHVLTPRSDSEILVEYALNLIFKKGLKTALDMCTGSGCLGITIAKYSNIKMTACDISKKALKIANKNAKNLNTKLVLKKSDMFNKIDEKYDLIISNPPYIETREIDGLEKEVKCYDPILALDGGDDGLKFYKIIENNAKKYLNKNGYLIMEIGETQLSDIKALFNNYHFVESLKDYGGLDRVVVFKIKENL